MSVDHYENFPVASILLPTHLRPAVKAIYHFARSADDLADEGEATAKERLDSLMQFEVALDSIAADAPCSLSAVANLAPIITKYKLPLKPFYDLLHAFKQDVTVKRYSQHRQLSDYCRYSANPVGYLMLALYQQISPENLSQSDAICTALQLTNFWQDVALDSKKGRIYIPLESCKHFGVSEEQILKGQCDTHWQALLGFEVQRTRAIMISGAPLAKKLPGRLGWELRFIVQGGLRILEKIEAVGYDIFLKRPTLSKSDWPIIFWRALVE